MLKSYSRPGDMMVQYTSVDMLLKQLSKRAYVAR